MVAHALAHVSLVAAARTKGNKMKVTKKQLKRIIQEEKEKIISEMTPADMGIAAAKMDAQRMEAGPKPGVARAKLTRGYSKGDKIWYVLSAVIDDAMSQSDPSTWMELANDLRGLADDVEDSIPEGI